MNLSAHFELDEFLRSETAARLGRQVEASKEIIANLTRLCTEVLEPIREKHGPITILSGYRPLWLNQAIGGAVGSEHMIGRAADILIHGMTPVQATAAVAQLVSDLPINQIIEEFGQWTHVSVCAVGQDPKRKALRAYKRGRQTVYEDARA